MEKRAKQRNIFGVLFVLTLALGACNTGSDESVIEPDIAATAPADAGTEAMATSPSADGAKLDLAAEDAGVSGLVVGTMPDAMVIVTATGEVSVMASRDQTLTVVADFAGLQSPQTAESSGGFVEAVFPLGNDFIAVELCCEPAAGALGIASLTGQGAPSRLMRNTLRVAVSPDGRQAVSSDVFQVQVSSASDIANDDFDNDPFIVFDELDGFVSDVAWLDNNVVLFDHSNLDGSTIHRFDLSNSRHVEVAADAYWHSPVAVNSDVVVVVEECCFSPPNGTTDPPTLVFLHAETLVEFDRFSLPIAGFRSIDARSGWLVIADDMGEAWTLNPADPATLMSVASDIQDIAWLPGQPAARRGEIRGRLPDGQSYVVRSESLLDTTVEGISAGIRIDLVDGIEPIEGPIVGIATFKKVTGSQQTGVDDKTGNVIVVSGDWYLDLDIYDNVFAELGESAPQTILEAIVQLESGDHEGLPAFGLLPPLQWATDIEVPLDMAVLYPDFQVRRGCSDLSVACSADASLEVVPGEKLYRPHSPWPGTQVEISAGAGSTDSSHNASAAVPCGDLDVFGVDPSGRFSYCLTPPERGLQTVLLNDGSGLVAAFADDERMFRLARWLDDDPAVWFRFVDPVTAVWKTSTGSTVVARRDDSGVFVDIYEFAYPFHDYDLAAEEVDVEDLRVFEPAFVNSAGPGLNVDLNQQFIGNFPEASARSQGGWHKGDTLGHMPACGSSTLYRDEVEGFSRVLDPAIELDAVQAVRSTRVLSGPAVHSGWRFRVVAIATACPAEYEGIQIYVGYETIDYGDNGPAGNPHFSLWGAYPSEQASVSGAIITSPTIGRVASGPFKEVLSIEFEGDLEPETVPQAVIVTVSDMAGVEHRLTVHNEVGAGADGFFLRTD